MSLKCVVLVIDEDQGTSGRAAENPAYMRSRLAKSLNVARGYASGFPSPAASADGFLSSLQTVQIGGRRSCFTQISQRTVRVCSILRSLRPCQTVVLIVREADC